MIIVPYSHSHQRYIIVPYNNAYAAVRNSFPCIPGLSPVQLGTLVTALSQLLYLTIIVAVMPRSDISRYCH